MNELISNAPDHARALYRELVSRRKECRACEGLRNPAESPFDLYDSEVIGPWSRWHGSLDARVMVVGQDWGDTKYYLDHEGLDEASGNPTNENLRRLLSSIGFEIGTPGNLESASEVFLTNLVLCLKSGGLQGATEETWFKNCAGRFFRDLLSIVQPAVVVSLGKQASQALLRDFEVEGVRGIPWKKVVEGAPYDLADSGSVLFPVYHCGARGVNLNRPLDRQLQDWLRIGDWLASPTLTH